MFCLIERRIEEGGGAVVERVGERNRRMDPLEAMFVKRQRPKKGRGGGHGMDGGADVMEETGEGELRGAGATAELVGGFKEEDGFFCAGDGNGGGKAVWAGADDDGVVGRFGVGGQVGILQWWGRGVSTWCWLDAKLEAHPRGVIASLPLPCVCSLQKKEAKRQSHEAWLPYGFEGGSGLLLGG